MEYIEDLISPSGAVVRTTGINEGYIIKMLTNNKAEKHEVSEDADGVITVRYKNGYKYKYTPIKVVPKPVESGWFKGEKYL